MESIPCGIQNHTLLPLLYIDQLYDLKEVMSPLCAIFFISRIQITMPVLSRTDPNYIIMLFSPNVWVIDLQPGL